MVFTSETLCDLDVFSFDNVDHNLFRKLNHCKIKGAESLLREACYIPFDNSTILQRQVAVKHIAEHFADWSFTVRENEIYYAEQYLTSSYDPVRAKNFFKQTTISLVRLFFQKPQYYFISSGIRQLLITLQAIRDLYIRAYKQNMPVLLKELFCELTACLDEIHLKPGTTELFLNGEPSPAVLFRTDSLFRITYSKNVTKVFAVYYKLEALYSLAAAHVSMELTFPVLTEYTQPLDIRNLKHPLIVDCKANPVHVQRNENLLIITGPNMAGKSSYIKSVGLAFFYVLYRNGYSGYRRPGTVIYIHIDQYSDQG